ncbi:hypothetical protein SAICODRAFT_31530 [Saitoella complicata NRRL Y-17804]|uniref:uncharacterized protein n=1 Tax=Saitoella complicata (strain BCRC 22490 / CBS 7301 / JCM 7358 / NBRC 10748 / NRRL Y-17804) TaxID=698492 RepID=UPI0008669540|nr:uncharacterized protein SAICODRAFT_31530 [Saitoella complicata NRRL Y-17804]ODQ51007.1 hypothetical protein SAICODRAFT_31530 [Saitoella complicata NRRL Y-17804]
MLPTGPVNERDIERQFALRAGTAAVPGAAATDSDGKPKRDDWMLAPPTQADWATSADARKVRARTFNTGKSGKDAASSGGDVDSRVWTETPQERARRLEEEVMGVRAPTLQGHATQVTKEETREEREKRERDEDIAERVRSARGPSLMEQHKEQQKEKEEEEKDDPSKRGFDRERDVVGRKVTGKMRDQLVEKARGLGGMFEGGKYL